MAKHFTQIEEGIAKAKTTIAKISTGIKSLQDIDMSKAPPIDTNVGDISALISGFGAGLTADQANIQTAFQQRQAEIAKGLPESQAQKGIAGLLGGILKERQEIRAQQPSTAELWKTTLAEFGFSPESFQKQQALMGQLVDYQKQMADLEAAKQTRLLNAEQQFQGYLTLALRGEQSLIERRYNSEIAAKGAQASVVAMQYEMERGMFQDAVAMTNQLVQLATFDQQQRLADLDWTRDTFMDLFDLMDKAEQREWERSYTFAKEELDTAKQETRDKSDLLLRAWQSGINPGWTADYMASRSLEELMTEVGPDIAARAAEAPTYAPSQMEKEYQAAGGQTGTGMTQFEYIQWRTGEGPDPDTDIGLSPQWFKERMEQEMRQSILPETLEDMWREYEGTTQDNSAVDRFREFKERNFDRDEAMKAMVLMVAQRSGYTPTQARDVKLDDLASDVAAEIKEAFEEVYGPQPPGFWEFLPFVGSPKVRK